MKITERQLRQIIREELLKEGLLDTIKGFFGKSEEEKAADIKALKRIEAIHNKYYPKKYHLPGGFMDKTGLTAFAKAFSVRKDNRLAAPGDPVKPIIPDPNLRLEIGYSGESVFDLDKNETRPREQEVVAYIADFLQDQFSPDGDLRENPAENLKALFSNIKKVAGLAKQAAKYDKHITKSGYRKQPNPDREGSIQSKDPTDTEDIDFSESLKKIIREEIIKFAEVK